MTHPMPHASMRQSAIWPALGMCLALLLCPAANANVGSNPEIVFPEQQYARLDPFESHSLKAADAAFPDDPRRRSVEALRAAAAAYDAFILEFPRSPAVPYALLRKGRSLHLEHKRFEAIKAYQEVLDYFPNDLAHAPAALYYIGEAHWHNGNEDDALRAWAKMASDEDYAKSRFAATAINQLAEALDKRGRAAEAVGYWTQVAVDFRTTNPDAARGAIEHVTRHHIRTAPDEAKLRKFYEQTRGFDQNPRQLDAEIAELRDYWNQVRSRVWRFAQFNDQEDELRKRYFGYWADRMDGRMDKWDDYQIDRAAFRLRATGDTAAWMARLDDQFARHGKADDYNRVVRWIRLYAGHPGKVDEYYKKLDFAKMSYDQTRTLMDALYGEVRNPELGRRVFDRIRLDDLDDGQRVALMRAMSRRDMRASEQVAASFTDQQRGKLELLRLYADGRTRDTQRGLKLAEEVVGFPDHANEAYWHQGVLHKAAGQFREAIAAFQSHRPSNAGDPAALYQIADCYMRLDQLAAAVRQLQEIESFFEPHAPEAAWRIALYYERAGVTDRYIASLRAVMNKYPKSPQSREVHHRLERLGLRIGGAIDDPDS